MHWRRALVSALEFGDSTDWIEVKNLALLYNELSKYWIFCIWFFNIVIDYNKVFHLSIRNRLSNFGWIWPEIYLRFWFQRRHGQAGSSRDGKLRRPRSPASPIADSLHLFQADKVGCQPVRFQCVCLLMRLFYKIWMTMLMSNFCFWVRVRFTVLNKLDVCNYSWICI